MMRIADNLAKADAAAPARIAYALRAVREHT